MNLLKRMVVVILVMLPVSGSWAAPQIQHWTTSKGLKVYFVPSDEIPMLDIRVLFDAGSARDKPELAGLSRVTSFMLGQSAGGRSADEMAEGFASTGAGFGASASADSASISLRTLTQKSYYDPAVALFLTALGQPDFRDEDLQRGKRQFLAAIEAEKASPGALSAKAFNEAIFDGHPYAQPGKGTQDSLAAITAADLQRFYKQYFVAANGVLTLVGAIDRAQAESLADSVESVLDVGSRAEALPEVVKTQDAASIRKAFPSQQAHVVMGSVGIKRDDPDRLKLVLANHILGGGGFTSRLVKKVREERGYAYSIYSFFSPRAQRGSFLIGMQTRGDQVDDALQITRETLKAFLEEGPSEEEFEAAKANVTGSFPLSISGNDQTIRNVSAIGFYGLPLDYLDTYVSRIDALTLEEVTEAFRRHIDPDQWVTVVVGGDE